MPRCVDTSEARRMYTNYLPGYSLLPCITSASECPLFLVLGEELFGLAMRRLLKLFFMEANILRPLPWEELREEPRGGRGSTYVLSKKVRA